MKEITNLESVRVVLIAKDKKHQEVELTVRHVKNLEKLVDFIELADPKKFNMTSFAYDPYKQEEMDLMELLHEIHFGPNPNRKCGTVCCALGHGPYAGIGDQPTTYQNWNDYSFEHFGMGGDGVNRFAWTWCFSGSWSIIDNTPTGAAKRIRYMLNNGVPLEFSHYDGVMLPSMDPKIYQ